MEIDIFALMVGKLRKRGKVVQLEILQRGLLSPNDMRDAMERAKYTKVRLMLVWKIMSRG